MAKSMLLLGLLVLTVSAVSYRKKAVVSKLDIKVIEPGDESLIDLNYLTAVLQKEFGSNLVQVPIEFIEMSAVEALFRANPYVRDAEVFVNKMGVLEVLVEPRKALLRVITKDNSYYLDGDGAAMPLSSIYAARIPVVHASDLNSKQLSINQKRDLITLIEAINQSTFHTALVDQIEIGRDGDYVLIPFIGKERIKFGKVNNIADKLDRILLFYKKNIGKGKWNNCKYVDVRFEGQIVCDKGE